MVKNLNHKEQDQDKDKKQDLNMLLNNTVTTPMMTKFFISQLNQTIYSLPKDKVQQIVQPPSKAPFPIMQHQCPEIKSFAFQFHLTQNIKKLLTSQCS